MTLISGWEMSYGEWDGGSVCNTCEAARRAYVMARSRRECFGHPVGASGLWMAYEVYKQVQGKAGDRQLGNADFGLTHNLAGAPFNSVVAVSILGRLN